MPSPIRPYNPSSPVIELRQFGKLRGIAGNLLRDEPAYFDGDWQGLLDLADGQGILPWLAWHSRAGNRLPVSSEAASDRLGRALRVANAAKLLGDAELSRLFGAARARGIPLLLFKGEALARTLHPDPGCRPTADFDLLVPTDKVPAMQEMLRELGYVSLFGFYGTHIFGEEFFTHKDDESGRVAQVDLHWDISNRRFFRNRLPMSILLNESSEIEIEDGSITVPSLPHSLLLACVHLAGLFPEDELQLKWLVDIFLLLEAMSESELAKLHEQAQAVGLGDVLALYCKLTHDVMGATRHAGFFGQAVPQNATSRARFYGWTCDHRWLDLLEYGLRLKGWPEKREFFRQVMEYRNAKRML